MSNRGDPNTIELRGFDAGGEPVFSLSLSVTEFPKAKHLWEDAEYIRSHRIARLLGTLRDDRGEMEQEYERHYDSDGRYLGGTIRYADGRTLHADTGGLEPSTIPHGEFVFRVHYLKLHDNPQPNGPEWYAFTLVLFDQTKRVYPVELFEFPKDQQPPAVQGAGATILEAYRDLRAKLLGMIPGELPAA